MGEFSIFGSSDDIVSTEVNGRAWDETVVPTLFAFEAGAKTLHVKCDFAGRRGSGWRLVVELDDPSEAGALPFDVSISQRLYSPMITVRATDSPVIVRVGKGEVLTIEP